MTLFLHELQELDASPGYVNWLMCFSFPETSALPLVVLSDTSKEPFLFNVFRMTYAILVVCDY
jgi:hypothetical protein